MSGGFISDIELKMNVQLCTSIEKYPFDFDTELIDNTQE
jgi:hypothetical protein